MQGFFQIDRYSAPMTEPISHLRRLREGAGLSVRELARRIGQQPTNVSFWERTGKTPRSDVLIPMTKALGVSVEELLGQSEPKRGAPDSRLGRTFEAVSQLPRRQQAKVLDVTEAMLAQVGAQTATAGQ
jgi:transcriptional regulator with XRE-family HTH domain